MGTTAKSVISFPLDALRDASDEKLQLASETVGEGMVTSRYIVATAETVEQ